MKTSFPITTHTLADQIAARQDELGLTDAELCTALGLEREIVLSMIKQGKVRLPIGKALALAAILELDATEVVRCVLRESSPDLLEIIEATFNTMSLTKAETNLIRHLRGLVGGQPYSPIVFDGKGVVALVAT